MATNNREGFVEKVTEFFTQNPADHKYEEEGGDSRVPAEERTNDPKSDARKYALAHGEDDPYPDMPPIK